MWPPAAAGSFPLPLWAAFTLAIRMTKTSPLMNPFLLLFLTLSVSSAAFTVYGPVPYRKAADSPFAAGLQAGSIFLENFEDRVVDPRIQMTNGMFVLDQGVDEDDGVLNDRNIGWVWYSSAVAGLDNRWTHEITFPGNGEGQRPLYAGLALLGFVQESLISRPSYYLQVFDGDNQPLSTMDYLIPTTIVPDGTEYASSLGDQFVGFYSERGISRILVGNTVRIDHVQFGMAIPEPGAAGLLLGTLLIGLRCRRR